MIRLSSIAGTLRNAAWRLSLLHAVDDHRVFWVTHGQGRVVLGPRRFGIGVHNFVFVPAGQPFAITPGAGLNGHLVTIPPAAPQWPPEPHLLRIRDAVTQGDIASHLESVLRESREERPLQEAALSHHAALIAIWLHRQLDQADAEDAKSSAADRLIAAFLDMLELRFHEGLSMATYSEALDVTALHLSRVCKTQLDRSAAQLIGERTLFAARDLLETTKTPIKTIANDLGFGSAAYFTRFIHKQTGQTPRALRKATPR